MLRNKVCLVTGGASGLGGELVKEYAKSGAKVLSLDIDEKNYAQPNIENIKCDVTNRENMDEVINYIINKYKKIDVIVTAAGIHKIVPFNKLTGDDFDKMISIHLTGTYNTIKPAIPHMVEQKYGKIITIASVAGLIGAGVEPAAHYAAAKGGIIALTKSLAREFGPDGINANSIAPGLIDTPLTSGFDPTNRLNYANSVPLRRVGKPNDIVGLAVFLSSEQSDFITGQVINVDGGYLMR